MAIKSVAFTMYPVTDMERSLAFYRDALGLPAGDVAMAYWTEFDVGGNTFGIGTFEQVGKPGTAASLTLEVDDLDALREKLTGLGFAVDAPHELETCRITGVNDPDGNRVWLHQNKRG